MKCHKIIRLCVLSALALVMVGANLWWKLCPSFIVPCSAASSVPAFDGIYDVIDSSPLSGNLNNGVRFPSFLTATDSIKIRVSGNEMIFTYVESESLGGRSFEYSKTHSYVDVPDGTKDSRIYKIVMGDAIKKRSIWGRQSGAGVLSVTGVGFQSEGFFFTPFLLGSVWNRISYSVEPTDIQGVLRVEAELKHGGTALLVFPWVDPTETCFVTLKKREDGVKGPSIMSNDACSPAIDNFNRKDNR